jgi:hypothetical protein
MHSWLCIPAICIIVAGLINSAGFGLAGLQQCPSYGLCIDFTWVLSDVLFMFYYLGFCLGFYLLFSTSFAYGLVFISTRAV